MHSVKMMGRGLLFFFLVVSIAGTAAASIAILPCEISGTVTIDGEPAPVGTLIIAFIDGEERDRITIQSPGLFGGTGAFDQRLVIPGTEDDIGKTITFTINEVQTDQTVTFESGESLHVDLMVGSPTPTPSLHGVFRNGQWIFAEGEDWTPTPLSDRPQFGQEGDIPIFYDGKPGVFRNGQWIFAEGAEWTPTPITDRRQFGQEGDTPIFYGGKPGVFRNGQWIFAEDEEWTPTPITDRRQFGQAGDIPVVLDGKPGVFRNGQWIFAEDEEWTPTPITDRRKFGQAGDIPIVLDGTPGVFRYGQWIFAEDDDWTPTPFADRPQFGQAGDLPFFGMIVPPPPRPPEPTVIIAIVPIDDSVNVPYGTSFVDAIAALAAETVYEGVVENPGSVPVDIEGWASTTYNPDKEGDHTFTGQAIAPEGYEFADGVETIVVATVTVGDGPEDRPITQVGPISTSVDRNTPKADIEFPVKAIAKAGTSWYSLDVEWDAESTPAYNRFVPGNYVFEGELINLPDYVTNPDSLKAEFTVTVNDTLMITAVVPIADRVDVPSGTSLANSIAELEAQTTYEGVVAYADNIVLEIEGWTSATYDPEAEGDYTFTGQAIAPEGYEFADGVETIVAATVTIGEGPEDRPITQVNPISTSVDRNTPKADIEFPAKAIAKAGTSWYSLDVEWDAESTPAYNRFVPGDYVFEGELINLPDYVTNPDSLKAAFTVTVKDTLMITAVVPIADRVDIPFGTSLANSIAALEAQTTYEGVVAYVDNVVLDIEGWNSATYDPEAEGEHTFTGQAIAPEGYEFADGVETIVAATVTVGERPEKPITQVGPISTSVDRNTPKADIEFPAKATAWAGDTKYNLNVEWDAESTPAYNRFVPGDYVFEGELINLPDYVTNPGNLRAVFTVTVKDTIMITAIVPIADRVDVPFGTSLADAMAALTAETVYEGVVAYIDNVVLDIEGWASATYDPEAARDHTFTGQGIAPEEYEFADSVETIVAATVTVGERPERPITQVGSMFTSVDRNTPKADIEFPVKATAWAGDTKYNLDVEWDSESTPVYNSFVPGDYVFEGELINLPDYVTNPDNLRAVFTVTVEEPICPEIAYVSTYHQWQTAIDIKTDRIILEADITLKGRERIEYDLKMLDLRGFTITLADGPLAFLGDGTTVKDGKIVGDVTWWSLDCTEVGCIWGDGAWKTWQYENKVMISGKGITFDNIVFEVDVA
ncbi:MAG: hypothetical protein D5R96_04135, partial [Methanocalculus sp. MSAO_Arc2]